MVNEKVNWLKLKNEYINTNISQRKLAEKYGVSFNTLKIKANKEHWSSIKKEQHNKITTEIQQKTAEIIIESEVSRIDKLLETADTMQLKIDEAIGQLSKYVDMFGNVHESDIIDVNRLKKLVAALKDIKDIIHIEDKSGFEKLDEVLRKIEGNI